MSWIRKIFLSLTFVEYWVKYAKSMLNIRISSAKYRRYWILLSMDDYWSLIRYSWTLFYSFFVEDRELETDCCSTRMNLSLLSRLTCLELWSFPCFWEFRSFELLDFLPLDDSSTSSAITFCSSWWRISIPAVEFWGDNRLGIRTSLLPINIEGLEGLKLNFLEFNQFFF